MLKVTNMARVRSFSVIAYSINTVGVCYNGNYAQKLFTKL